MLLDKRIPIKFLFKSIKWEVLTVTFYVSVIVLLDDFLNIQDILIPVAIPGILGTAISLILSFRTSQSYERWWEARKIWGEIVNDSRTWARQVLVFLKEDQPLSENQKILINRQIEWVILLRKRLRDESPEQITPSAVLVEQAQTIKQNYELGLLSNYDFVEMNRTLNRLTDAMGKCERIRNTVFPKSYSLFVEFFLYLFVGLLPFSIINHNYYVEGFIVIAISLPFFLLEKSAIRLQDPFTTHPSSVPIGAISKNIEKELGQYTERQLSVEEYTHDYYVL